MTKARSFEETGANHLGKSPIEEMSFLLIPRTTYERIAVVAKLQGCTVAVVFEKALLQYIRSVEDVAEDAEQQEIVEQQQKPERRVDVMVRRRR